MANPAELGGPRPVGASHAPGAPRPFPGRARGLPFPPRAPGRVFALAYTPAEAEATRGADGWCEVGAVVDGRRGRACVVRWHPARRRGRLAC